MALTSRTAIWAVFSVDLSTLTGKSPLRNEIVRLSRLVGVGVAQRVELVRHVVRHTQDDVCASGAVGVESVDDLPTVVAVVERGVIQRDQHVTERGVVEGVRGDRKLEFPGGVDSVGFERAQQIRLQVDVEDPGGVDR